MAAQLLLVNRRRKKRRAMSALQRQYFGKRRRKRRAHARVTNRRRHKRARRAVGYVVGHAPVRRRKLNRRRHHVHARRRHRRYANPRLFSLSGIKSAVIPAATGALGAIALDVGMSYLPLPAALQSQWAQIGVKALGAIALGMVAGKLLGREKGKAVTAGALTVVAYGALKGVVQQMVPSLPGLSGDMGAYMPSLSGPAMQPAPYVGAYMNSGGGLDSLRAKQMGCVNDGM